MGAVVSAGDSLRGHADKSSERYQVNLVPDAAMPMASTLASIARRGLCPAAHRHERSDALVHRDGAARQYRYSATSRKHAAERAMIVCGERLRVVVARQHLAAMEAALRARPPGARRARDVVEQQWLRPPRRRPRGGEGGGAVDAAAARGGRRRLGLGAGGGVGRQRRRRALGSAGGGESLATRSSASSRASSRRRCGRASRRRARSSRSTSGCSADAGVVPHAAMARVPPRPQAADGAAARSIQTRGGRSARGGGGGGAQPERW